ncbi:STAS domain-containing protein [candidate division KSB1 bacterium]
MIQKNREENGFVIVELEGDVVGGPDAAQLNNLVHDFVKKGRVNIIVDLSKVQLMSSSGLGILIGALTTLRQAGGDLVLVNITERIQNLLTITKLSTVFKVFKTIEDAKNA